jgi:predicted outer membrane repeat protein
MSRNHRHLVQSLRCIRSASAALIVTGVAVLALSITSAQASSPAKNSNTAQVAHAANGSRVHFLSLRPFAVSHSFHAVITVDSSFDGSDAASNCAAGHSAESCTLRDAIDRADADSPHLDQVVIPKGRHITLSQGPLNITNSMDIVGTGAFVNGAANLVFNVSNTSALTITGVSVSGASGANGGALYCTSASVSLVGVNFSHNSATNGGAVYNEESCNLWISNSTFSANTASSDGGALYLVGGSVIKGTTIGGASSSLGNQAHMGAGMYNENGPSILLNSNVKHNSSGSNFGEGVGIYNDETMDVVNSSISYNSAGAGSDGVGIYNSGTLQLSNSFVNYNSSSGANSSYGAGLDDNGNAARLTNVSFIGNSSRVSGYKIDGGAVYTDSYSFEWNDGSISDTTNGQGGQSDQINGGAIYADATNNLVSNVSIAATSNNSLPSSDTYGGDVYVNGGVSLSNCQMTATTNVAPDIYGGAIYVNSHEAASVVNSSVTNTKNTASSNNGGDVYGGALYNTAYMTMTNFSATNTTDLAKVANSSGPSANESYIEGGVLNSEDYFDGSGISLNGATITASGGDGQVEGGALFVNEPTVLNNFQAINFKVTADNFIVGGLYYNNDHVDATNFTLGNSTVKVLGGVDASAPHGDGTIIYNDDNYPINFVNATIVGVNSSVPVTSQLNSGIDNGGWMSFSDSTIYGDSFSGPASSQTALIVAKPGYITSFNNSIVAASQPWKTCLRVGTGAILSLGHNIDNGTTCHFYKPGDMQNTKAKVLALANNGGLVLTAALTAPGSPAINHGDNETCFATDARGVSRPQHGTCDIGAFEVK